MSQLPSMPSDISLLKLMNTIMSGKLNKKHNFAKKLLNRT